MHASRPRRSAAELSQRRAANAPGIDTAGINRLQQQPLASGTPAFAINNLTELGDAVG